MDLQDRVQYYVTEQLRKISEQANDQASSQKDMPVVGCGKVRRLHGTHYRISSNVGWWPQAITVGAHLKISSKKVVQPEDLLPQNSARVVQCISNENLDVKGSTVLRDIEQNEEELHYVRLWVQEGDLYFLRNNVYNFVDQCPQALQQLIVGALRSCRSTRHSKPNFHAHFICIGMAISSSDAGTQ